MYGACTASEEGLHVAECEGDAPLRLVGRRELHLSERVDEVHGGCHYRSEAGWHLHVGPVGRLVDTRPGEHRQSGKATPAVGTPSSNAGEAATCSGEMAAALAQPANHVLRAMQRAPRSLFCQRHEKIGWNAHKTRF